MSSLIFKTEQDKAIVATDTLAVSLDGSPYCFQSKANYIPHLRTIIAGTGAGGFSNEWHFLASTHMIMCGIHDLDFRTPEMLRELWKDYKERHPMINDAITTTVYQFGISEESGEIVSFAYRSINNFKSESLQFGVGIKPYCLLEKEKEDFLNSIPDIMAKQRKNEAENAHGHRLYIGGEIVALILTKEGCNYINIKKFEDFDIDKKAIKLNN